MLDDWVNTVNELNSGSLDSSRAAVLPLSAAQKSAYATAVSQIARFSGVPQDSPDVDCVHAVAGGLDYGGAPATFVPLQESCLSLRPAGSTPRELSSLLGAGTIYFVAKAIHALCQEIKQKPDCRKPA